jgi:hypothetical protein
MPERKMENGTAAEFSMGSPIVAGVIDVGNKFNLCEFIILLQDRLRKNKRNL